MKTIYAIGFTAVLFTSAAFADLTPCDGFKIVVSNQLPDMLLVTKVSLDGAEITPSHIDKISSGSKETFSVINSANGRGMTGIIDLHTLSIPSKKVKIQFTLDNAVAVCSHTDTTQNQNNDFPATASREIGAVHYTVG